MKTIPITILLLILNISVIAQMEFLEGFIINSKGDTVKGYIQDNADKHLFRSVNFKIKGNESAISYTPDKLIGFGMSNGEIFISKQISGATENDSSTYFMKCLVSGEATLYVFRRNNNKRTYFIETNDSNFTELLNTISTGHKDGVTYNKYHYEFRGILKFLFQECKVLMPVIDEVKFKLEDIMNLVVDYNLFRRSFDPVKVHLVKEKIVSNEILVSAPVYGERDPSYRFRLSRNIINLDFNQNIVLGYGLEYIHGTNNRKMRTLELKWLAKYQFANTKLKPYAYITLSTFALNRQNSIFYGNNVHYRFIIVNEATIGTGINYNLNGKDVIGFDVTASVLTGISVGISYARQKRKSKSPITPTSSRLAPTF
jgi:hypothetical protein